MVPDIACCILMSKDFFRKIKQPLINLTEPTLVHPNIFKLTGMYPAPQQLGQVQAGSNLCDAVRGACAERRW